MVPPVVTTAIVSRVVFISRYQPRKSAAPGTKRLRKSTRLEARLLLAPFPALKGLRETTIRYPCLAQSVTADIHALSPDQWPYLEVAKIVLRATESHDEKDKCFSRSDEGPPYRGLASIACDIRKSPTMYKELGYKRDDVLRPPQLAKRLSD